MPATFFDLPPELQLLIQDFISPTDLRTHVCVFLSDPRCASLYWDEFWSHLLWKNGIGQLSDEDETQATWCDIAVSVVTADGFCTHPQCGEALLEYNRTRMRETSQHLRPLVPMVIDDKNYKGEQNTASHRIFGLINFRPSNEVNPWDKPPVSDDAHLGPESGQAIAKSRLPEDEREYLSEHPLAARSFATFAPTASFLYYGLYGIELEHSTLRSRALRRPLTVLDVLGLLQLNLDNDVSVRNVMDYVSAHEKCLIERCALPTELMRYLRTTRDILTVCPIQDMELEEYTENGPAFSLDLH